MGGILILSKRVRLISTAHEPLELTHVLRKFSCSNHLSIIFRLDKFEGNRDLELLLEPRLSIKRSKPNVELEAEIKSLRCNLRV